MSAEPHITLIEIAANNERRYSHLGCGGPWIVPMDDTPRPTEWECPECTQTLPVVIGHSQRPIAIPPEYPDQVWITKPRLGLQLQAREHWTHRPGGDDAEPYIPVAHAREDTQRALWAAMDYVCPSCHRAVPYEARKPGTLSAALCPYCDDGTVLFSAEARWRKRAEQGEAAVRAALGSDRNAIVTAAEALYAEDVAAEGGSANWNALGGYIKDRYCALAKAALRAVGKE